MPLKASTIFTGRFGRYNPAHPAMRYSWQELVLAAFAAPPESLPARIAAAEAAIAARLKDPHRPDIREKLALTDALNALHMLICENVRDEQRKKEDIA